MAKWAVEHEVSEGIASSRQRFEPSDSLTPFIVFNLNRLDTLAHMSKPVSVIVRLATLSYGETAEWERRINSAANACGCGEAAAFMLTTLGCLGFMALFLWPVLRAHWISAGFLGSVLMLASVAAGKGVGRTRAKRRLLRTIDALRIIVQGRSAECHVCTTQESSIPERKYW